ACDYGFIRNRKHFRTRPNCGCAAGDCMLRMQSPALMQATGPFRPWCGAYAAVAESQHHIPGIIRMRNRCNRLNALSFATVIALGASTFASAQATDKANLATLDDGSSRFQRLLVTYANGSEPRSDAASFERTIGAAATAANRSLGAGKALQFK